MLKCDTYTERKPALQIGDLTLFVEHTKQRFYEEGQQPGESQIVMREMSGMLKIRSDRDYERLSSVAVSGKTLDISEFAPMFTGQCWCVDLMLVPPVHPWEKKPEDNLANNEEPKPRIIAYAKLQLTGEVKFQ